MIEPEARGDAACWTNFLTLKAPDALRTGRVLINFYINRAGSLTGIAHQAVIKINFYLEGTDSVKKAQDCSQRTNCPAEWSLAQGHPDQEKHQQAHLPGKEKTKLRSKTGVD